MLFLVETLCHYLFFSFFHSSRQSLGFCMNASSEAIVRIWLFYWAALELNVQIWKLFPLFGACFWLKWEMHWHSNVGSFLSAHNKTCYWFWCLSLVLMALADMTMTCSNRNELAWNIRVLLYFHLTIHSGRTNNSTWGYWSTYSGTFREVVPRLPHHLTCINSLNGWEY